MSISKGRERRETLTTASKFCTIFLSIHTGIACRDVCVYWTLSSLCYNVDYTSDSSTVIQRRSSAAHDFYALYVVYIQAVKVYVVISAFAAKALAIYEKQHRLTVHSLITNLLRLTHRIVKKLYAGQRIFEQTDHINGVHRGYLIFSDHAGYDWYVLQRFFYARTCYDDFIKSACGQFEYHFQQCIFCSLEVDGLWRVA